MTRLKDDKRWWKYDKNDKRLQQKGNKKVITIEYDYDKGCFPNKIQTMTRLEDD